MKTKFFTMALLLTMSLTTTATAFENPQTKEETEAARMEAYRQRIGLDYSMPDYHTRKFDASVMGEHLAKMLLNLDEHKDQQISPLTGKRLQVSSVGKPIIWTSAP